MTTLRDCPYGCCAVGAAPIRAPRHRLEERIVMETDVRIGARCSAKARVAACTPLCREHVEIELVVEAFPASEPGQFLQLLCADDRAREVLTHEYADDGFPSVADADFCDRQPFLRRPFSIADRWSAPEGEVHLCVISRTVGPGTRWLAQLAAGATVDVTGPLGRGFRIPAPHLPLVLVVGGVGIPPLLYLARRLDELGHRDVTMILGATTRALLSLRLSDEPNREGKPTACVRLRGRGTYPALVTSDDGTIGLRGLVKDGLRAYQRGRDAGATPPEVCACGPNGMLRAIADLTRELGLPCQLCIERNMGCVIGTCLSCVVRARDEARREGWRWALACTDGPVFARDELLDFGRTTSA